MGVRAEYVTWQHQAGQTQVAGSDGAVVRQLTKAAFYAITQHSSAGSQLCLIYSLSLKTDSVLLHLHRQACSSHGEILDRHLMQVPTMIWQGESASISPAMAEGEIRTYHLYKNHRLARSVPSAFVEECLGHSKLSCCFRPDVEESSASFSLH